MRQIADKLYEKLEFLGIINSSTRETNIGESNYATKTIQPWSLWLDYPELTSFDHDIIKRVLRTKKSDARRLDYEKIIHICQERIRQIDVLEKNFQFINRKSSEKYECIQSWFLDDGDMLFEPFTQGRIYTMIDGLMADNSGTESIISKEHLVKYFKKVE